MPECKRPFKLKPTGTPDEQPRRFRHCVSSQPVVELLERAMKKCASCGRENGDDAMQCRECGGEEWVLPAPASGSGSPWEKIAVLEYEVEAEHLGAQLADRNIPHLMRSYHDSALDGLFQLSQGWGHVEAPREFKAAIWSILRDIRGTSSNS